MRQSDNAARNLAAEQNADDLTKELFAQPAMTINDLYDDPAVQLRIAQIIDLATHRAKAAKSRLREPRKLVAASDYALDGSTVGHFDFYGRYG